MVNLLVGLALGLSMLSAAAVWVNLQWQNDRQILLRSHSQQDVRALMDTLVHDLRRANFQALRAGSDNGLPGLCPSAFCGLAEDFDVSSHQILFSVDRNDNGLKDNNECSGFRVNAKELQTKTACQPPVWSTLSDSKNLQILELNFRLQCDNSPDNQGDLLVVQLRSQASSDKWPSTWQRLVRLRNHSAHVRPAAQNCTDNSA